MGAKLSKKEIVRCFCPEMTTSREPSSLRNNYTSQQENPDILEDEPSLSEESEEDGVTIKDLPLPDLSSSDSIGTLDQKSRNSLKKQSLAGSLEETLKYREKQLPELEACSSAEKNGLDETVQIHTKKKNKKSSQFRGLKTERTKVNTGRNHLTKVDTE